MVKSKVILTFSISFVFWFSAHSQCDVNFSSPVALTWDGSCGGSSTTNLNLGSSNAMGDGDTFTFDTPSTITIDDNFQLKADGDGTIIIPAGVVVNVDNGTMQFDGDGGCNNSSSCSFELIINGTLNINGGNNFQNNLEELTISGTGTFNISGQFQNTSNGCAACGASSCPAFPDSDCTDGGVGPCGTNFCGADGNIGNNTPLPVDLIFFKATSKQGEVCLDWATSTEINNDYFTVERSKNGLDYELVDYVDGNGNSNEIIYYSLMDNEPYSGISYYRLTQTDFDGKFEVFPIQFVENNARDFILYPTALRTGDLLNIDLTSYTESHFPITVEVRDILGRNVIQESIFRPEIHKLKTDNIVEAGVYLILVNDEFMGRINLN